MGMSVWNQVDSDKYFSISTIDRKIMAKFGLNLTVKQLRELARNSPPYDEILTGQSRVMGYRQKTKIYRYEDFKDVQIKGESV